MKYWAVMILLAVTMGACAQTAMTDVEQKNEETTVGKKDPSSNPQKEPACRVCDFDYENYSGELNKKEIKGLLLALNDEYLATAIYLKVNEKFDDPRPFINIVRAEMRHADRLKQLFKDYDMPIPKNPWLDDAPVFDSILSACEASIEAEIENAKLYERLFETTEREKILSVYTALKRASDENHKPAFSRCVGRKGKMGPGRGYGRGRN